MKKFFTLLLIIVATAAQSQHLLKHNYVLLEEKEEEVKDDGSATTNAPLLKVDNYESFLTNFGGFNVLPKIQVMGDRYGLNRSQPFSFKAFVAGTNVDSAMPIQANKLYFLDASQFGFDFIKSFTFGKVYKKAEKKADNTYELIYLSEDERKALKKDHSLAKNYTHTGHRFAWNLQGHYLGKNFVDTSLSKEAPSKFGAHVVHLKSGLEWALLPDNLSLFWNMNYAFVVTGRDAFKKLFNYKKYGYFFNEAGISARIGLVEPPEEKAGGGMDMYFTAGAIIHSGDTRSLSGGNDAVVPYIRLGLNVNITKK